MDREAWQSRVHGVAKGWTQLNDSHTHRRNDYLFLPGTSMDEVPSTGQGMYRWP